MTAVAKLIENTNTTIVIETKPIPVARSKTKCGNDGCGHKPAPIVGDCTYCGFKFCAQHRLPETHKCVNMKVCYQTAKTENTNRLNSQAMSSVMNVGY
jgi:predicted nucleic acid binding AN1-type Zn finger protein